MTSTTTATAAVIIEKGTCGFHSYSPISTLERQYAPPVGQRLYIFVQANANACLLGGVESVLKIRPAPPSNHKNNSNNNNNSMSSSNNASSPSTNQHPVDSSSKTPLDVSQNNVIGAPGSGNKNSCTDPFSFLGQDSGTGTGTGGVAATGTATTTTTTGRGPNIGRFLKKVAHSTTQTLERGMTNLAIRADGGKSPDLLVLGLYDDSPNSSNTSVLLGMTESKPLPDSQQRLNGVQFQVPLVLSGPTTVAGDAVICIKLWIRSGAALLQGTKSAKNYLLGSAVVPVSQLRQSLAASSRTSNQKGCFMSLDLQSNLVVNGKLNVCIVPDLKFPPPCARGWTLADPTDVSSSLSGYQGGMFNLPLDQSYVFPISSSSSSSSSSGGGMSTCIASERAIESVVVLPVATAFMQLAARAAQNSLAHATSVASRVYAARHDSFVGEYADCNVRIGSLKISQPGVAPSSSTDPSASTGGGIYSNDVPSSAFLSMSWQRPDSIFEVDLLTPTRLPTSPLTSAAPPTSSISNDFVPNMNVRFYPKPVRDRILPAILQACGGQLPRATGFLLGNLRLLIAIPRPSNATNMSTGIAIHAENPFAPFGTGTQGVAAAEEEHWECIIGLEGLLIQPPPVAGGSPPVLEYPVFHSSSGRQMGTLVVQIDLKLQQGQPVPPKAVSAHGGLVSLVGLMPLCDGISPDLDHDMSLVHQQPHTDQRRQQQLSTMGAFITHAYMDHHVRTTRTADCNELQERATRYRAALSAAAVPLEQRLPPHEDRTPKPFRPSSSRMNRLLSGIPFNAHTASLSLNVMNPENTTTAEPLGDVFYNITCGAPSDHARGFASVFPSNMPPNAGLNSPVGVVSGGLRRLEAKRAEIAKLVADMQTMLILQVANFFVLARQNQKYINHVPGSNAELQELRWKLFEAIQSLHHLTWICATRRANCFSQALGLAVTSYLASISDPAKLQSTWPSLWARHGYMVSFEGLLSAAGKELGMIEDASVGIDMLRMVKAIVVSDDGTPNAEKVPVVFSPYLKWIRLTPTIGPPGSMTEFTLELGIVPSYYEKRIPSVLKNGTAVRFYSLLFEVGVDIRQFGAHAGSNMTKQLKQRVTTNSDVSQQQQQQQQRPQSPALTSTGSDGGGDSGGGLLNDEDDDVGVTDDDVLVQLNYEAFHKLNAYAHLISPVQPQQKIHPLLETLYQHIASSSGKMNHDILDEAALLSKQLGGGGIVFCKSGKDRTAMHWTYKASQFATTFRQRGHWASTVAMGHEQQPAPTNDTTLEDAMMLRVYGTRLPICEKNVGQAKYAFNSLQVKFMPDALKPPMNTLAGFLKGGKVFSGGGIES